MNKNEFWIILGGLIVGAGGLMRKNYGFISNAGWEGVGANFVTFLFYLWGAWAIYKLVFIYILSKNKQLPNNKTNAHAMTPKEEPVSSRKILLATLSMLVFLCVIGTFSYVRSIKSTNGLEEKNMVAYRQCVIDAIRDIKESNEEKRGEELQMIKDGDLSGAAKVIFSLAEYDTLPVEFIKRTGVTENSWNNVILQKNGDCVMISHARHTPTDGSWSDFAITDVNRDKIIDTVVYVKNKFADDINGLQSFSDTYKRIH